MNGRATLPQQILFQEAKLIYNRLTLVILPPSGPLEENKRPNTGPQKITKTQFSHLGFLAQFRHFDLCKQ